MGTVFKETSPKRAILDTTMRSWWMATAMLVVAVGNCTSWASEVYVTPDGTPDGAEPSSRLSIWPPPRRTANLSRLGPRSGSARGTTVWARSSRTSRSMAPRISRSSTALCPAPGYRGGRDPAQQRPRVVLGTGHQRRRHHPRAQHRPETHQPHHPRGRPGRETG